MKKLILLLSVAALVLGIAGTALAADEELPHTGRILIAVGGDIDVPAGEQADAVIVVNGEARVAGTVNSLLVVDGTATITGGTLETLAIVNGQAVLRGDTSILHDVYRYASTVDLAESVAFGGEVRDLTGDLVAFGIFIGLAALALWIGIGIATLVAGLLIAGLAARQVRSATALISREPVTTFLVGLLAVIVPPVLAVMAIVTIVGAPTGLAILLVIWPAAAFIGYVVAAIWIGEWLLYRRGDRPVPERPYGAALLGLAVAFVIGLVPVATAILSLFGLGAVVRAAWRTLRGTGTQAAPQGAPVPVA